MINQIKGEGENYVGTKPFVKLQIIMNSIKQLKEFRFRIIYCSNNARIMVNFLKRLNTVTSVSSRFTP